MKNFFLSTLLVLSSLATMAQTTEGHVAYKIDVTTDNPDMQMVVGMMQGSTMDVYFKDKTTRSEMKMGSMMTMITITNETTEDLLMLMSGMVGQNAIKTTLTELDEQKTTEENPFTVTLVDETKVIEGYTCKKAILTSEEGLESVFWYTEDIDISKKGQSYLNDQVPGFPMQFELNNGPMKMSMTVTKIEKSIDKKKAATLFDMTIPEGYKEMTMEDLKSMGSMGM
jgi:GLPGLI family protein